MGLLEGSWEPGAEQRATYYLALSRPANIAFIRKRQRRGLISVDLTVHLLGRPCSLRRRVTARGHWAGRKLEKRIGLQETRMPAGAGDLSLLAELLNCMCDHDTGLWESLPGNSCPLKILKQTEAARKEFYFNAVIRVSCHPCTSHRQTKISPWSS